MPALNKVQLIGYLGKDPESRTTPTGKTVASFSVAVTRRWRVGSETKEATDWFNVETWGRQADLSQKYLKKGSLVYIEVACRPTAMKTRAAKPSTSRRSSPATSDPSTVSRPRNRLRR